MDNTLEESFTIKKQIGGWWLFLDGEGVSGPYPTSVRASLGRRIVAARNALFALPGAENVNRTLGAAGDIQIRSCCVNLTAAEADLMGAGRASREIELVLACKTALGLLQNPDADRFDADTVEKTLVATIARAEGR